MTMPVVFRQLTCHSKRTLGVALVAVTLLVCLGTPTTAYAQPQMSEEDIVISEADARLRGYEERNVVVPGRAVALAYFAFVGLAVIAAGVMFKSSRRTHLD